MHPKVASPHATGRHLALPPLHEGPSAHYTTECPMLRPGEFSSAKPSLTQNIGRPSLVRLPSGFSAHFARRKSASRGGEDVQKVGGMASRVQSLASGLHNAAPETKLDGALRASAQTPRSAPKACWGKERTADEVSICRHTARNTEAKSQPGGRKGGGEGRRPLGGITSPPSRPEAAAGSSSSTKLPTPPPSAPPTGAGGVRSCDDAG